MKRTAGIVFLLLAFGSIVGCSRLPGRVSPPSIAGDAGEAAVAKFDQNGDGALSGAELDRVASIKSALPRFDRDGDGKVSAEEIDARIQAWRDTQIGLLQAVPTVLLDGIPLSGAQVRLVPEEFLGPVVQPAQATTNEAGQAPLKVPGSETPLGVQLGLYRIEISKKSGDRETIPPRYNTATELGVEVALDNSTVARNWRLNLRSD